ncbi:beta-galactosidase [Vagococcus penaei]|uniref:Beta-galactosidase n=2 Tax=Vagococcus penaei TaxID=633807 RepID=A0A1Q2D5R8_9ENTE|nr:beta-galactosidase [Vagococcus penaei]RST99241.1 beta-galactosidase [Vagococcus penaei]
MQVFNQFLYGGDYNPNQWPKEIWQEDMQAFNDAHINSATINVFSWARLQKSESDYDFSELDAIVALLQQEKKEIVMGTATAALPAWLFKRYPEVGRVDFYGRQHVFGQRHNACPNSLVYQKYAQALVSKLAERYGGEPYVSCWHINNEYGGECFCANCQKAFRVWLKEKYQTIESINDAWNLAFWGHTIYDWDDIVVPNYLSEGLDEQNTAFAGISLDYRRFMSDSLLNNFKLERDAIRAVDTTTPITTNLMGTYKGLDYFKWAKEMDIVSWDNYPAYDTPWSQVAMTHDLMRGLKQQPFMLMEQTPSQQNWQPYNSLKKPGQMRAQSYQSIAHGADTIQFFQLRRSKGACEKFHGAVIEHVGGTTKTRVFNEVQALGKELATIGTELMGTQSRNKVAIIFDWDNYWALEYTSGPNKDLTYVAQIHQYYAAFYQQNIGVDLIEPTADLSNYSLVIAPVLYMVTDEVANNIQSYVASGGHLITTFMSGIVDQSDNVHLGGYPGPLREMLGIWVEEIDALAPEQSNTIAFEDGTTGHAHLLCDIIHLEGATSLGHYTSNFYETYPFATKHSFGKGQAWYVGTELDTTSLHKLVNDIIAQLSLQRVVNDATDLEITCRESETHQYYFVMNFTNQSQMLPQEFVGAYDMLSDKYLTNNQPLAVYDCVIVRREN